MWEEVGDFEERWWMMVEGVVCIGSLHRCIVACAHLGNGTGRRTVTMAAPLVLNSITSSPVRYEASQFGLGQAQCGWVPTCDSAHSWGLNSAASQEHQIPSTMTCYPPQSHYPETDPISPCPTLIMSSSRLGNNKYQF